MIAAERQTREHRFRGTRGYGRSGRQPVTYDPVIELGVEIAVVERDTGAAVPAGVGGGSKAPDDFALP